MMLRKSHECLHSADAPLRRCNTDEAEPYKLLKQVCRACLNIVGFEFDVPYALKVGGEMKPLLLENHDAVPICK
jgi:hypothetical protein